MSEEHQQIPFGSQIIEGLQLPGPFSPDVVRSAIRYKPRPEDLFIASFPKSGTTWAQHIVALIYRQGQLSPLSILDSLISMPFLEAIGPEGVEMMTRPGSIKIHLPFRLAPWSEQAKYICITRNPKDCCVSLFHHMKYLPMHGYPGDFNDFFEEFLAGKNDFGDYFDHLLGWSEHRNDPNVLFLTYEQMRRDTREAVLKMASFIDDEKYAEPLRQDPEKLNNILKHSSFEFMKENFNKGMEQMFSMSLEDLQNGQYPEAMKSMLTKMFERSVANKEDLKAKPVNFVRKGIIGDWRNHLSEDQSKRMDEKFATRTKGTEIANWWKDCM